jgi:glycosyltransferase involved in cell wall biosynthesis
VNLALLIGRFPPGVFGGAEFQAEQWARRLSARHRVLVVTRRNAPGDVELERRDGFTIRRLPVSRLPLLRTLFDLGRIERAVREAEPCPQLTLCFQTFVSGYAGVRIQRRLGIPAVVWVRGEDEYRLERARTGRLSVPVWDEAAGVLVQSESNRDRVLEAVRRLRPAAEARIAAKIEVAPNGIELPDSGLLAAAREGSGTAAPARGRILAVGRLIHDKGMDVVVDAVAGLQGLLTVAGDGPERARLEARALRHGLDARFEGAVARERLDALYRSALCVVLASRRGEGLPNVLIEAFACGRAVVATSVTGVTDLVRDGVNGLLVPPGDPLALRDALARLAHERGLAERLGAAARETAAAFAWERVLPRLEACLERWGRRAPGGAGAGAR